MDKRGEETSFLLTLPLREEVSRGIESPLTLPPQPSHSPGVSGRASPHGCTTHHPGGSHHTGGLSNRDITRVTEGTRGIGGIILIITDVSGKVIHTM